MTLTDDPFIGKKLGNYEIQGVLGHGGMARVYQGYDAVLQRYAAIKVIDSHLVTGREAEEYRQRFLREARSIARLNHPNIVTIYDYNSIDKLNLNYMVMAFIEGQDLRHIIREHSERRQRMPYASILRIVRDTAEALDYAHEAGVIHRDVKPSNIMVSKHGRAVLTDFGLALNLTEGTMGNTFGSVHYIAPEQAVSSDQAVAQSDLYSLGVVMFEMMTGQVPFDDPQPMSVAMKHLNEPPPPPRLLNPELPIEVEAVILKALGKEPEKRYNSGAEMVEALETALAAGGAVPLRVGALPSASKGPEESGTFAFSEDLNLQQGDTPAFKIETPTGERPILPPAGQSATDSQPASLPKSFSRPLPPPSWLSKQQSNPITNPDTRTLTPPPLPSSQLQPQRKRPNFLMMGLGLALIAAAIVLVVLAMNGVDVTLPLGGGTPGATSVAALLTDEVTERPTLAATATPRPATSIPTTVAAVVVEATDTRQPPTAGPTRRPTNTDEPEETATEAATEAPALTVSENSIILRYDEDVLTAFNPGDDSLDLSGLTFVSEDEDGDSLIFDADVWVGSSQNAGELQPGNCFMVWRNVLSELDAPDYCSKKDAWWAVGSPRWFWVSDDPAATFEIRRDEDVLATCAISDGECVVELE
jgi:serine/threonine protein kinase